MASDRIELVHRSRSFYDVWVNGIETGTQVAIYNTGDLSEIVTRELHRQAMREAMRREGLT